jgi:hypothetical protein
MARPQRADVRREYAYWLATPRRLRVSLGLPTSDLAFAEMKDIDPRSLRRWKSEQKFMEMVESFKVEMANSAPNAAIARVGEAAPIAKAPRPVTEADDPALEPGLTADEQKYLQVKDTLIRMAMDGNQGAMDLYLKHYGKTFVDAERQEFADYSGMSDSQLVYELCEMAGVEAVSGWLAERAASE